LKKIPAIIIVIFFCWLPHFLFSQDTIHEPKSELVRAGDQINVDDLTWDTFSDTSIINKNLLPRFFKGGLASPYDVLYPTLVDPGLRLGMSTNDLFSFTADSIRYFNTRTPYTDLTLLISSKKEQYFELVHSQNITERWNAALHLLRTSGEGYYQRQNAVSNNLSVSSNFRSKNGRYGFAIAGLTRNFKKDENGGIVSDSSLEANIFANKRLFSVRLEDARSRRGYRELKMDHYWYFGPRITETKPDTFMRTVPRSYLGFSSDVSESWFVYSDKNPLSGFYSAVFLDTIATLDSTHFLKFENNLRWRTLENEGILKNTNTELILGNEYALVHEYESDSTFNDLFASGRLFSDPDLSDPDLKWSISGKYYFSGSHAGEYKAEGELKKRIGANGSLSLSGGAAYASVSYLYTYYRSNNFWWYNDFDKITSFSGKVAYHAPQWKLSVGAAYVDQDHFVYLDVTCLPQQSNSILRTGSVFIKKDLMIKHWNFNTLVLFQKNSAPELQPISEFAVDHSLFYSGAWFKGVMQVAIGADVHFFSSYSANAYMPALGSFYLQNEKKIGNYPFVDAFFNFKVKRARIFLRAEHFASGLIGTQYYLAPHYPGNDRQFRVGVSWKFFD
jgi:hypothetical protein